MTLGLVLETVCKDVVALKPGKQFNVATNAERKYALTVGRVLGKRLVTKKRKTTGFTIAELAQ